MARLVLDVSPLKESPGFRWLWVGSSVSQFGSQLTLFAVALQVFTVTGSSLAVGAVGLCAAVPSVGLALLGGSTADAVDRRKLVLGTTSGLALVSVGFVVQAALGNRAVWVLYALVVVQGLVSAVNAPARRTFVARLLPKRQLAAGAALTMAAMHASAIAGPVVAGVIAGAWGLKVCYLVDALSFAASFIGVARLPSMRPEGAPARPGLRAVGEALGVVKRDRVLLGAFLADLCVTLVGSPVALFPAVNVERFGGAAQTLGLLTAAVAVGGLLGSTFSGPALRVRAQGRAQLILCIAWGVFTCGFGLSYGLVPALVFLTLSGAADALIVVLRSAVVQAVTPDRYRGRITAADYVVGVSGPQAGRFRAGAVATLTSTTASAVGGGLAAAGTAVLLWVTLPRFARYRSSED
ncbi:MFS transporter [Actinokineospora inagensis]|uniref:MFS transporter n=1 Tax=Actinokineospora inagensis TaxID=103730 RepID=UPI00047C35ED|nr:MFS transporter [Actinokineospora inagensis]